MLAPLVVVHSDGLTSTSLFSVQAMEVAAYALSLLRPGRDAAILPGDAATRDFADFCRELLGVQDHQVGDEENAWHAAAVCLSLHDACAQCCQWVCVWGGGDC